VAPTPVAILGVSGRMGQSLVRLLKEAPALKLVGALASPQSVHVNHDAALEGPATGVLISGDPGEALHRARLALDFSSAGAVGAHAKLCAERGIGLLVGTTGLTEAAQAALHAAASKIPVLIAPNTSVAVSVLMDLARRAASSLGEFDIEIAEAHHKDKRDAPSGTALALGEAVARARGTTLQAAGAYQRHGAARAEGSIGFAVTRAGDIVGEHTVLFAAAGERLEITHRATDRAIFARGALKAAVWLQSQAAGLYRMSDVVAVQN
jgi:4-hydroxy-tetrahydrodipicolinate reductase